MGDRPVFMAPWLITVWVVWSLLAGRFLDLSGRYGSLMTFQVMAVSLSHGPDLKKLGPFSFLSTASPQGKSITGRFGPDQPRDF